MNEEIVELFEEAIRRHVSDIYILPKVKGYEISFSTAAKFEFYKKISTNQAIHLINFFKFKADMSLSERRRPQLGAWTYEQKGHKIFCRFSSVGTFLDRKSVV